MESEIKKRIRSKEQMMILHQRMIPILDPEYPETEYTEQIES